MRDLLDAWREKAKLLREHAHEPSARVYDICARQLEDALQAEEQHLLTLRQAAALSGYTEEHLGRLVRDGKIDNAGRRGAPRVRRSDVPIKAGWRGRRAKTTRREPDRTAIVRRALGKS